MDTPDLLVTGADELPALLGFLDAQRTDLQSLVEGLTEEEARASLVTSRTTVLGIIKHATWVERSWFGARIPGRPRSEIGIVETPDESFELAPTDTIGTVLSGFQVAWSQSKMACRGLDLEDAVSHPRLGELSVRWVLLHLIREHARHAGHGDILREQLLARRTA